MVVDEIIRAATESGCKYIESEYIATPKNEMVRNHYDVLGFRELDKPGNYRLRVEDYQPKNNFIEKISDYVNG